MPDAQLDVLLDYLKRSRGFDFTGYKRATLARRIAKRMDAVGVESDVDYVDYLEVHPDEFALLFNTILINVTAFFRDGPAWDYLVDEAVPRVLDGVGDNAPIRVWCAGCASGEETYTMAMVLAEALGEEAYTQRVKIYATDVDEEALDEARHATYSAQALEPVPGAFRERYFEPLDQRFAFRKDLRRTVIFGRNDLLQDAPISRVDLLTCRNTLMYFNAEAQARILQRFHFALNQWGYLFLGKSEMLITHAELFKPISLQRRLFSKVARPTLRERLLFMTHGADFEPAIDASGPLRSGAFDAAPTAQIAVDAEGALVMANKQARLMFRLGPNDMGRPLKDLEISYRPADLRTHLDLAYSERRGVALDTVTATVASGDVRDFDVQIAPLFTGDTTLGASIAFADVTAQRRLREELEGSKRDLEHAYEELQSTVEELETTNEELQSTNEELETTNEELQSTNEELETMNEELQSTNEELETINDELSQRTLQLDEVNAFLETILTSMGLAVIVVDRELTVRVWNAHATDLWGLRPDEAEGRHLLNLDAGLPVDELRQPLRALIANDEDRAELTLETVNRRGRAVACRVVAVPLRGGDGVSGAIVLIDATELATG